MEAETAARRAPVFDLGKATNAQMSGTRTGELFLRLATVDKERLSNFQAEEAERKRREEEAARKPEIFIVK